MQIVPPHLLIRCWEGLGTDPEEKRGPASGINAELADRSEMLDPHGPIREEKRFKSARQAQRFLSAQGLIYGHFRPRRHRMAASVYRAARAGAFRVWREETYAQRAI